MQNSLPHWRCIRLYLPQAAADYAPHPAHYIRHLLLKEKALGWARFSACTKRCVPLIRLAIRSTPSPVWEKAFIVAHFHHAWPLYLTIADRYEQQMHPTTPPWHADFNRRGLAKPDHRGKMKNRPGGVYSRPSDSSFSLPRGGGSAAFQFNLIDFHVTHRFFVTFLVRPALLPYGKRGFRAAIYKIARPQPPAAAL